MITDESCYNCRCVCTRDRLDSVLEGGGESKSESGDLFLYSPLKVIIFVALMSGMLLLMYFFYNILGKWNCKPALVHRTIRINRSLLMWSILLLSLLLHPVYIIIAIFCLASASALFSCLDAVMDLIGCGTVRYESNFSLKGISYLWASVFT